MAYLKFFLPLLFFVTTVKGQDEQSLYYFSQPVKILNLNGLYSTVDWKSEMVDKLTLMFGEQETKAIIQGAHESAWPVGIVNLEARATNQVKMPDYKCRYITTVNKSMAVLMIMAEENREMDEDLRPIKDFYMVILESSIESNESQKTENWVQLFHDEMEVIAKDFKYDFTHLKGAPIEFPSHDEEVLYVCDVSLQGAYDLTFYRENPSSYTSFRAVFYGDINHELALIKYQYLAHQVEIAKLSFCSLVKKEETANGHERNLDFSIAAKNGYLDPAYESMIINVALEPVEAFTVEGEIVTEWSPVIYIYKE